jgi:hypothetical protein
VIFSKDEADDGLGRFRQQCRRGHGKTCPADCRRGSRNSHSAPAGDMKPVAQRPDVRSRRKEPRSLRHRHPHIASVSPLSPDWRSLLLTMNATVSAIISCLTMSPGATGRVLMGGRGFTSADNQDPRHANARADLRARSPSPMSCYRPFPPRWADVLYRRYLPRAEYRGDGFAAEHVSWNRSKRPATKSFGYFRLKDGIPTGEYDDFVTGFVVNDSEVWGAGPLA